MSAERPWAQNYQDDPATAELIRRRVVIPYHEDLHREARSFLDPPFKASLGKWNTELLGMHHYTVHLKVGIAREYLDELGERLRTHNFGMATAAALLFSKLLDGFFTNLVGAFDNLAQELNLVYDLGLSESSSFADVLNIASASKKRTEEQRKLPTDDRIARLLPTLTDTEFGENLRAIARYRKYITHRKLTSSLTTVRAAVSSLVDPFPRGLREPRIPAPSASVARTSSGGVSFEPSGSIRRTENTGVTSQTPFQPLERASFFLPRREKLDILPTETKAEDMDSREIVDICDDLYRWTVESLGKIYEVLLEHFKSLA